MAATVAATSGSLLLGFAAPNAAHHHRLRLLQHHHLSFCLRKPALIPLSIKPTKPLSRKPSLVCFSSLNRPFPQTNSNSHPNPSLQAPVISNSTKTLAALFALSVSLSSKIAQSITNSVVKLKSFCSTPTPQELQTIQYLQDNVLCTVGPLFFAAIRSRPSGYLNTPLTVVAAGMAKWLDIYSGVLLVRVLLSWFPNIPWDRQPLSAIRDLCDPYLNLFRNIIPPIFDTLDISPLFAFTVLGVLGSILNSAKGV